jgi:hypothetical protein
LKATVEFALHRYDLGGPFLEYLRNLNLDAFAPRRVVGAGPSLE